MRRLQPDRAKKNTHTRLTMLVVGHRATSIDCSTLPRRKDLLPLVLDLLGVAGGGAERAFPALVMRVAHTMTTAKQATFRTLSALEALRDVAEYLCRNLPL